ncbi:MAG: alpha-keto acid decarboxylase family protein [Planctomycetota bacterium]
MAIDSGVSIAKDHAGLEPRPEKSAPGIRPAQPSIGQYLIRRLMDHGIRDVFGIPGDYVLSFYAMLDESPLRVIGCTREDCAGFAADGYARINGIGAVCVTYCVGGLSLCNSVAGAFAEKSPVVVISGSPGMRERFKDPMLHHRVRDFHTQLDVFRSLCAAAAVLSEPQWAFREIDRVLTAVVRQRRPGYIELPRDMVHVVPENPYEPTSAQQSSDPEALREALSESARRLAQAARPVVLAGVELHRFALQKPFLRLIESARLPVCATMLSKSVISEAHPLFAGMYEGAMGREEVTRFVEESDCVLVLGAFMTDIDLGINTAKLDPAKCIYATSETLRISHHHFEGVLLGDFIAGLAESGIRAPGRPLPRWAATDGKAVVPQPDDPITIERLIGRLNQSLDENTVVVADIGDALFASSELTIRQATEYLSPAYYTSMGFAVPATLGVLVARPNLRAIALVGDGAFQMTGMELSTIVRHGFAPIVIVLDNGGYGTERLLHPGNYEFNEIHAWQYHRLPEILGGGTGYDVRTEGEFDAALRAAMADRHAMSLIHVRLNRSDSSQVLQRLARKLGTKI